MYWLIITTFCWRIFLLDVGAITLIEGPENATVPYGANHTLNCRFNETVKCSWTVNSNIPVEIGLRYRYISNNSVNSTDDCSIEIASFQKIDAGFWQCKADDFAIGQASLLVAPIILLDDAPIANLSVFANGTQSGNLTCEIEDLLNLSDPLSWSVDGSPVNLGNVSAISCNKEFCTYRLSWTDDWSLLVNAVNMSCIARDGTPSSITTVTTLGFKDEVPSEVPIAPASIMSWTVIIIITAGSTAGLIVIIFCLVACICANTSRNKTSPEIDFIPIVGLNYFASGSSLDDSVINPNSCSKHSLPETSLVDGGYCGSEKLEEELVVKPEYGNGVLMIHYSSSVNSKRNPIDSLYVNRWSTPQPPKKSQSLGCRAVRSRLPLPFGASEPSVNTFEGTSSGPYSIVRDPRVQIPKSVPNRKPNADDPHLYYEPPL